MCLCTMARCAHLLNQSSDPWNAGKHPLEVPLLMSTTTECTFGGTSTGRVWSYSQVVD